jgi:hypothetical protein
VLISIRPVQEAREALKETNRHDLREEEQDGTVMKIVGSIRWKDNMVIREEA